MRLQTKTFRAAWTNKEVKIIPLPLKTYKTAKYKRVLNVGHF